MSAASMKTISITQVGLPLYVGLESSNEDVVYAYLREAFTQRGYSLRVKRSGCHEIDQTMRSAKTGKHGRGACDAYVFSDADVVGFHGLIELESNGRLDDGIKQIKVYAGSLTAKTLEASLADSVKKIRNRDVALVVFDGNTLWLATYSLDTEKFTVIVDKESVQADRAGLTKKLFSIFPNRAPSTQKIDEKSLVKKVAGLIRGKEKFQKNKALVMTILASIFGATGNRDFGKGIQTLKKSQEQYDKKIFESYQGVIRELGDGCETLLQTLYEETAAVLSELSHDRGMDLYGFIYEELSTKDTKKEQGEYYTPRHTVRPIIAAVIREHLKWESEELSGKVVFDPFCGSGGMLYEYIHALKTKFSLDKDEIDDIARQSVFGADKASILAAYLNLYLVGDGSANLRQVATTLNWRKEPFLRVERKGKGNAVVRPFNVDDKNGQGERKDALERAKTRIDDLGFLLKLYGDAKSKVSSEKLVDLFGKQSFPIGSAIGIDDNKAGKVDLLLTNVPYGKITDQLEKCFGSVSTPFPFGGTLEANALKECVDFLRPAKMENGKVIEKGGVAIVIVPDSILENPSTKPIRDYLIERCDILGIVGLPPFTFSPYAMEKTYALVFRKIAPEAFDAERDLSANNVFMYYSLSDGKANSVNRFPTKHMREVEIKVPGDAKKRKVVEFIHNDFDPCFDRYEGESSYLSKLERAWSNAAAMLNKDWDQERITEQWSSSGWMVEPGRKWGFFPLVREKREYREEVKSKKLSEKILAALDVDEMRDAGDMEVDVDNIRTKITLLDSEQEKFDSLAYAEVVIDADGKANLAMFRNTDIVDVVLNPDAPCYLGCKRPQRKLSDAYADIVKMDGTGALSAESLIEYFTSEFLLSGLSNFKLSEKFDVLQGTQFSKEDAYTYPGTIPVYTAATNGPAYLCSESIPGKVLVKGPLLIWSRKGAKAGTIQLFSPGEGEESTCFISDVSGAIKAKSGQDGFDADLTFLRYYVAGQVRSKIQARDNNAQLNKSKLESLTLAIPADHKKIGAFLRSKGL